MFLYLNCFFSPTSESVQVSGGSGKSKVEAAQQVEDLDRPSETDEHAGDGDEFPVEEEENMEGDFTKFTGRKKRLWELRMKMVWLYNIMAHRLNCHRVAWII